MSDLERFQHKLDAANPTPEPEANTTAASAGQAMRLGAELLAGALVGMGAGWALDRWLGTSPWLLVVCFFFGCAAGFRNLLRAAERM